METAEYEIMFRVEDHHWWYRALHRILFHHLDRHLPEWRTQPILDAGCGTGAILKRLGNPEQTTGLDLAPEAVAFCRQRGLQNVIQGNICALPFADESFAGVVCSSVLYHRWVPEVSVALKELHRVLQNGGMLLVNLPACASLASRHDEVVFTTRRFRAKQVREFLEASGFELVRLSYWTSLVFPLVWLARRSGCVAGGRDFDENGVPSQAINELMNAVMLSEFWLMRWMPMPIGVSIFFVARKISRR